MELQKDIEKYSKPKPLQISCTMQLLCPPKDSTNHENRDRDYQVDENDPDARLCEVKLKINVMKSINITKMEEKNLCSGFSYDEHPVLLPHSTNCSLVSFLAEKNQMNCKKSIVTVSHFLLYYQCSNIFYKFRERERERERE